MELLEYWPEFLREVLEFQVLAKAEQPELDKALEAVRKTPDDFFISTLSEYGAERWERNMGFPAAHGGELKDRRFRILARYCERLPYTYRRLEQLLGSLCGEDGYTMELRAGEYTLTVRVALTAKQNFDDVGALLKRVTPANIVIDLELKYNQQGTLAGYTHAQLAAWTHEQLRNEVLT